MNAILWIYIILLGIGIVNLIFTLIWYYRFEQDMKELNEKIKRELEEMRK